MIGTFKLPIEYLDIKYKINENILNDLELDENYDISINLYNKIFNVNSEYETNNLQLWNKYYTTDIDFLNDSQQLYKSIDISNNYDLNNFNMIWKEIKEETSFKEKYNYVDWEWFEHINHSPFLLEFSSIYNLTSPVSALFFPIFMLILPFLIIKMQGIPITMHQYIETLKKVMGSHVLSKLLSDFNEVSWEKKTYLITSVIFYVVQIYQNLLICLKFYNNIYRIHNYLFEIKAYIEYTNRNIDFLYEYTKDFKSYSEFNNNILLHKQDLNEIYNYLKELTQFKITNFKKILEIGDVMWLFYQIYYNDEYNNTIEYSFGLNGYINNILNIKNNIISKNISFCKYSKSGTCKFKKAYYAPLLNNKPVKNNYSLNNNKIITGPNASGKTTLLKTTLFNILLSQQIGCGFYSGAKIVPFDYIHCYLNIPDTSARDSLFQAEARRCKEILTMIEKHSDKRHFCIFDELYSGTNPYEAVASAYSFLRYITSYKSINFMLTTHYIDLCKLLNKTKKITNYNMNTLVENNDFIFKYNIKKGISTIKGGINVLIQFDYPDKIIKDAEVVLKKT